MLFRSEALKDSGKVDPKVVRQKVRDHHLSDDGGPAEGKTTPKTSEAPPRAKPRTSSEVRQFFSLEAKIESPAATLAKTIENFIKGAVSDADMKTAWDAAFPAAEEN